MSASFRNGGVNGATASGAGPGTGSDPKATHKFTMAEGVDNAAYESAAETPPALKVSIGILELMWGLFTNVLQVTTSTIAIMAMILTGATVSLLNVGTLSKMYPWTFTIGFIIAGSIQVCLHMNAQSISGTWMRLRHIQSFHINSKQSALEVWSAMTFRTILGIIALIADVISDATFVNLYTHNGFVITFWIVFLTGSSTIVLYDGATRVWGAIEDFKDYKAYHDKYDVKEK